MKLLLDTCTFLWMIWDEAPLTAGVHEILSDAGNEAYLSAVSVWEATVKHRLGKLSLNADEPAWQHFTRQRTLHGALALPLTESDVRHVQNLPDNHRDPFDRLLICQAIEHGLTLVTPDPQIRRYPIKTLWA
jgi:PIN domain nuclease of toxin-antitoxin system